MKTEILTAGGTYFDLLQPEKSHIDIYDIATSLSNLCRFNGHTKDFYSVAQHSVMVSDILPKELRLAGLLHDAAEAYVGDVTSPLKQLLPDYKEIERNIEAAVFTKFGLPLVMPPEVKHADLVMLATEQRDLMPHHADQWELIENVVPLPGTILAWTPWQAYTVFMHTFNRIIKEK